MPRNVIFLTFTHQTVQSHLREVFGVTRSNPSPSFFCFESGKLYLTGSSSPDYKSTSWQLLLAMLVGIVLPVDEVRAGEAS